MSATELKVVPNATCTFCGCVCDDMELTVEGTRITKAKKTLQAAGYVRLVRPAQLGANGRTAAQYTLSPRRPS